MADELERAIRQRDLGLLAEPRSRGVQPRKPGLLDLPGGVTERLALLNQFLNPVEAIGQSMQAGERMMQPNMGGYDRLAALGDMLSGVAGVAGPAVAAGRAGLPAATAIIEGLLGGSPTTQAAGGMARQFAVDESGALRLGAGEAIDDALRAKYPGVKISVTGDASRGYTLNKIDVPKPQRSSGIGTQIMQDLVGAVDAQGATLKLSPSGDFGGSVPRLKEFYKRFGFVENKGKAKDFGISESMYRLPQSSPAPILPSPRNDAEAMARDILQLRAEGRADEVTDQMMAAADPQYMYSNTPLPMDYASRMARAEAFDETGYHSTSADFPYFAPPTKAGVETFPTQQPTFLTRSEAAASDMGRGSGTNIIPVRARTASLFDPAMLQENPEARWLEDSWSPLGRKLLDDISAGRIADAADDPESYAAAAASGQWDIVESAPFQQWLRQQGFSDFNVNEAGNANFAVVDPARIRSRFARFDPAFAHLRNLNAALAAGVPIGLLSMQPNEEQY
jgi:GNAT superfamily N-acetyltransferase